MKYIKRIQLTNNLENYVRYIENYFLDIDSFHEKFNKIKDRYKDNEALAFKFRLLRKLFLYFYGMIIIFLIKILLYESVKFMVEATGLHA